MTPDGRPGPTGEGGFAAEAGRYHLYVALICPWASRTLIARRLKGLEGVIAVAVVDPVMTGQGWRFGDDPGAGPDLVNGATYLHEIYTRADPHYTGRATVPVLWDRRSGRSSTTNRPTSSGCSTPASARSPNRRLIYIHLILLDEIDALNDQMYGGLNNGVYRAGFATTQVAYEDAFKQVFATLDALEARLADGRRFLFGDRFTESDIRAFVTLVRFDVAYHGVFKCNRRRIVDYPALQAYLLRVLDWRGDSRRRCRSTTSSAAIMRSSRSTQRDRSARTGHSRVDRSRLSACAHGPL